MDTISERGGTIQDAVGGGGKRAKCVCGSRRMVTLGGMEWIRNMRPSKALWTTPEASSPGVIWKIYYCPLFAKTDATAICPAIYPVGQDRTGQSLDRREKDLELSGPGAGQDWTGQARAWTGERQIQSDQGQGQGSTKQGWTGLDRAGQRAREGSRATRARVWAGQGWIGTGNRSSSIWAVPGQDWAEPGRERGRDPELPGPGPRAGQHRAGVDSAWTGLDMAG